MEESSDDSIIKKVLSKINTFKIKAKSEVKETRALVRILTHAIKSYSKKREFDLNEEDKDFIRSQSSDLVKNIVLIIVALIPLPIPLTPFLVIFGKKIGVDFIPKTQDIPDKGKPKKDRQNESKRLEIIITEEQLKVIEERLKKYESKIHKLCLNQKEGGPFCRLYDLSNELTEDDNKKLNDAIEIMDKYFRFNNVGLFPIIVDLSLKDYNRTVNFLNLISDFISNSEYDETETKRILQKQKNAKNIVTDVQGLVDMAKELEYTSYEKSFVGKHFKPQPTKLMLNYRCGDDAKERLFTILTQIKSEDKTLEIVLDGIKKCITQSLTNGTYYIKADIELNRDLTYDGDVIFKRGESFEVKKMDPFIDSYLSEFFSIFKESAILEYKEGYIDLYNQLIDELFLWLNSNKDADNYLKKVKDKMSGIIYDNNVIIPSEFIELYWSNKGQRGCDERRLSIRFRINPDFNQITTYTFKNEDELLKHEMNVPYKDKQKVLCKI